MNRPHESDDLSAQQIDRALLRGMAYALAAFCLYWLLGGTASVWP